MAKYYHIRFSGINWYISINTTTQYSFKGLKGYILLNPYHYSKAYVQNNLMSEDYLNDIDGHFHLFTNGIILKKYDSGDLNTNEFPKLLSSLFRHIRFESMQVGIRSNESISWITSSSYVKHGPLESKAIKGMRIRSVDFNTMVTWANIKEADKKLSNKTEIPVFEEMLLDAYKSFRENEYNKAILFSVIAIESLLAHTYDRIYEEQKNLKRISKIHRFISNRDGSVKDPIVKLLLDRTDFKRLLHEVPLYLMNKSLLTEKEQVYHNLIKLYNTRNKIVHWGAPIHNDPDKLIPIDAQGAELAMKISIETFNWLDIRKYDILLNNSFIRIN